MSGVILISNLTENVCNLEPLGMILYIYRYIQTVDAKFLSKRSILASYEVRL